MKRNWQRSAFIACVATGCYSQPAEDGDGSTTAATGSASTGPGAGTGDASGIDPSSDAETTIPAPTTTADPTGDPPTGCQSSADCDNPSLPLCIDGTCGNCGDAEDPDSACEELDTSAPICNGADCVQCTDATHCGGMTPACERSTGTCVSCQYHEQCPGSACDIFDGECLPTDQVWWVALSCPGGNAGIGSEQSPFCDIAEALAQIPPGGIGTVFVSGGGPNDEAIDVGGGRTIAFLGVDGPVFFWPSLVPDVPAVRVGDATVYLQEFHLEGRDSYAIEGVTGSRIGLDRCVIHQSSNADNVRLTNSQLIARNTAIGNAGLTQSMMPFAAIAANGSTLDLTYVTVMDNHGVGAPDGIVCDAATTGAMRNSIVFEDGPPPVDSIDCTGLSITHSATNQLEPGEGNVAIPIQFDYDMIDVTGDNYYGLSAGSALIPIVQGVAQWEAGDPVVDFDGDPRPLVPGTPDFPGADIP